MNNNNLNDEHHQMELHIARMECINRYRLPQEIADRIQGDSVDQIRKDAKMLSNYFGESTPKRNQEATDEPINPITTTLKRIFDQ